MICYPKSIVRRFWFMMGLLAGGLLAGVSRADTFQLNNGKTVTGEVLVSAANDVGITIKVGEGDYEKVSWESFSQADLKKFAQNKKLETFVEPYIEITHEEKAKKTEGNIKQPPRLERVAKHSLFAAFFGSGLGVLIVLLLYAANVYAAYEIAIFRARPVPLVCGVAAVLPVAGPILFLSLGTRLQPAEQKWEAPPAEAAASSTAEAVNPMQGEVPHVAGLKVSHAEPAPAPSGPVAATTFQRGQFTFNRRFFETRFPGFFGVVRRDADKNMDLIIKSARGFFVGQRISRIAANDLHLEVHKGHASEEVMIPFTEIQEVQLKPKETS
jgi:hypothetical protein